MNPTHTLPTTDTANTREPAGTAKPETPADVLRAAADYIARYGWTQGSYYSDTSCATPPACALGAIAMAAYGRPVDDPFDPNLPGHRHFTRAAVFFTDYLDIRHGDFHPEMSFIDLLSGPDVGTWNDKPGRTRRQVIAALRAAATDWETTHTPGGAQ